MTIAKSLSEMYGSMDVAQVQADYQHVLVPGETVEYACEKVRDLFIVTDRRILDVDTPHGISKSYDSIAFSKVGRFSVEFGGALDDKVLVTIWVSGAGGKEMVFDKKTANSEGIQKVLATKIL